MAIETILTLVYTVVMFGFFMGLMAWALSRAEPDFPEERATNRSSARDAGVRGQTLREAT